MIPSSCYGRALEIWLLYSKIPIFIRERLYIFSFNETEVIPVPFLMPCRYNVYLGMFSAYRLSNRSGADIQEVI